jgi:predicted nucleic acid-binding protein
VIVVDTNVFVALSDRRDAHHTACRDWLAGCDEPLVVPPTVLAEACYMIDKYLGAERARAVPLIDEVRPLVERRLDEVGHDPAARVFTGPRGGRITTAVLRDATHWDEVVTRIGYEHLRRHDLRHTGLTWMADAGVPVHVLRKIAGHGSLVTTQRYLHPDAQSIADAGIALSAHLALEKGFQAPQWSPNGPQLRLIEGDKP